MGDPTGTAGAAGAIKENSFEVAAKGGPKFMARLEQLAEATDRHDEAFAKLEIGQSAVAAFNRAQQKLAEAEHSKAEAEALRRQAAKTLNEAQASAKAKAVEADQIVAAANARQKQADQRLKQIEERERVATEAQAKAQRAEAEANRLRDALQSKTDYLRMQIREIAHA